MDPINKAERNTSLLNFSFVYILILALPLMLAYWMGTKKSSGGGSQRVSNEQEFLAKEMTALQEDVKIIEGQNGGLPSASDANETWNDWLSKAELQNREFYEKIKAFQNKPGLKTTHSLNIRKHACSYLFQISLQRTNYLQNRRQLLNTQKGTADAGQLKTENDQLKSEIQTLKHEKDILDIKLAKKESGGGGGGGGGGGAQPDPKVEELTWTLRYTVADCKKAQADNLVECNKNLERRTLYVKARKDFQQISEKAMKFFQIQQQASDRVEEIDKTLSRL